MMTAAKRTPLADEKTTATLRESTKKKLHALKKLGNFSSLDALVDHLARVCGDDPELLRKRGSGR